jgi:hypothetical protein
MLWREIADDLSDRMPRGLALMPLARAIYGHHGSPAMEDSHLGLRALYGRAGLAAATQFARETVDLLLPAPVTVPLSCADMARASFPVAGFAVLADWLGRCIGRGQRKHYRTGHGR